MTRRKSYSRSRCSSSSLIFSRAIPLIFSLVVPSLLLLLSSHVGGVSALYDGSDDVQIFSSKSDFKSRVLESDQVWVVQFYAPWCGHCKALTPKYKQLATILKGIVGVGAIDAATDGQPGKRIASTYGISGFPTVKIFAKDRTDSPVDYQGSREVMDMVQGILQEVAKTVEFRVTSMGLGGGKQKQQRGSSSSGGDGGGGGGGSGPSKVVKLTSENFQKEVLENPLVSMVAFIAPWCGHCKALLPEWDTASAQIDGQGAFLGVVDATVETDLANTYGVKGYPTIKLFPGGTNKSPSDATDYNGERKASSIVQYVLAEVDRTGVPAEIPQLTNSTVLHENCDGPNRICILVGLPHILDSGAEGRNKYRDMIANIAKKFRGSAGAFRFLWFEGTSQPELESALELTAGFPSAVALSLDRNAYAVFRGSFTEKALGKFLSAITTGRQGTVKLEGALPEVKTVDPWDGKDGEVVEEEFSLDDIMGDEL